MFLFLKMATPASFLVSLNKLLGFLPQDWWGTTPTHLLESGFSYLCLL